MSSPSDADKAKRHTVAGSSRPEGLDRVAHLPFLVRKMNRRSNFSKEWKDPNRITHTDPMSVRRMAQEATTGSSMASTRDKSETTDLSRKEKAQEKLHETQEQTTDKDAFFDNAMHLQTLMEEASETDDLSESSLEDAEEDAELVSGEGTSLLANNQKRRKKRSKGRCHRLKGHIRRWKALLRPNEIQNAIEKFLKVDVLLGMLPLLAAAFILFYGLGNPDLEFLPNTATLAWYLIFVVRLQVTFALARCTQFVLEVVAIRTSWLAQWSGPFLALIAMQSIGWPFLLTAFGSWNLILLHGHHPFCKHWLNFTNISIFTVQDNPDGDGILQSDIYGRILFAMVFVGCATGLKRTTIALFLSRRMLRNYKVQLEGIMEHVKLIAGLSELASETEKPHFAEILADAQEDQSVRSVTSQVQMELKSGYMDSVPTFSTPTTVDENKTEVPTEITAQSEDDKWQGLKDQVVEEQKTQAGAPVLLPEAATYTDPVGASVQLDKATLERPVSTFERVLASLDHYDPPTDNEAKHDFPSLHDILQFRKAKVFVETGYPFTDVFGPADTRKHCVQSAIQVFQKLQLFDTDNKNEDNVLSFDVIGALAYREDGELDETRAQDLLRLFPPDGDNLITLDEFVQACDSVYKQMIFLGASMRNASKIDSVLEEMFTVGFNGVLAVMILSLVGLNPYPLLVSFGTMLLSLAFALGPSCAKTIEGILAIAVRRPFDLGDRISLASGLAASSPGAGDTWIVEDINLTTTTLRFAATNEVSTINNSSLSEARIVNCARSSKAIVRFRVCFRVDASVQQLQEFRQLLAKYIDERPQVWARMVQFANDGIQSDDGYIIYMIGVQHLKAWQELSKIVTHKGELTREADRIAHELGIHFEGPPGKINAELVQKKTDVC